MNTEEIIEGNKLIAEFMGCYGDTHYVGGEEVYRYGFKNTHITERWHENYFDNRTPYHSSWDWLMTAVEKAKELVDKYRDYCQAWEFSNTPNEDEDEKSAKCALIAVDEILSIYNNLDEDADLMFSKEINYWQEVKNEITKL